MEHTLAEESAAEPHAVQSANKMIAVVDLYRVAVTVIEQRPVYAANTDIDPSACAVLLGFSAAFDDRVEVAVNIDRIARGADGTGETSRKMKPPQRNDPPHVRLDPVECGVVGTFRHRKNPAGVRLQQHVRRDLDESVFAVCHGASLSYGTANTGRKQGVSEPDLLTLSTPEMQQTFVCWGLCRGTQAGAKPTGRPGNEPDAGRYFGFGG